MKMKLIFVFAVLFAFNFSQKAYALEITSSLDGYDEYFFDEDKKDGLYSSVPEGAAEILEELGITEMSLKELFAVTPKKVFSMLFDVLSGSLKEPFLFCTLSALVLLISSLGSDILRGGKILEAAALSVSALVLAVPLTNTVSAVFSLNESLCEFGAVFSGVFAAAVSSSGGNVTAVAYEGAVIFFNSIISVLSVSFSKPLINGMCASAFFSCVSSFSFTARMSELFKKLYISLLSFFGTVFTAFLSLKSVISHSADTITAKSMKFIIGRAVPVVGGAVSESYSFVTAGLSLVKNTVGVFGIASIAVAVLPTLLTLFSWKAALFLCEGLAEMFSPSAGKAVFSVFRDVITLLISTVIFISAVFIVSAGVLLVVTGGNVK